MKLRLPRTLKEKAKNNLSKQTLINISFKHLYCGKEFAEPCKKLEKTFLDESRVFFENSPHQINQKCASSFFEKADRAYCYVKEHIYDDLQRRKLSCNGVRSARGQKYWKCEKGSTLSKRRIQGPGRWYAASCTPPVQCHWTLPLFILKKWRETVYCVVWNF